MKKIISMALLSVFCFTAFAGNQYIDNYDYNPEPEKVKVYYGPQAGTFALSFSALPVINFVGNMFNGTTNQSFDGLSGVGSSVFDGTTIDMKFYTSDRLGLVLGAGFNCLSKSSFGYGANSDDVVTSKARELSNQFMLTAGMQYVTRPGSRLQPVVGTRLLYAFRNESEKFNDKDNDRNDYKESSPTNTVGLVLDLGVEYFLTQSISLSAYADLGLYASVSRIKKSSDTEDYSKKSSARTTFGTGQLGGNLALNFYF